MKCLVRAGCVAAFLLSAGIGVAASVVGTWHGKFFVDHSALPKAATPAKAAQMAQRLKTMDDLLAKAQITLSLKSNHTFTFIGVNVPGSAGTQTSEGTYRVDAGTVTIVPATANGKKAMGSSAAPQTFKIGPNARDLTLVVPNRGPVKVSVVFTR